MEDWFEDAKEYLADAHGAEVGVSLDAVRWLLDHLRALEELLVSDARNQGMSWQAIAEALGRRRQSVWERYKDAEPWEDASPAAGPPE